jgi:hypothetical protein
MTDMSLVNGQLIADPTTYLLQGWCRKVGAAVDVIQV